MTSSERLDQILVRVTVLCTVVVAGILLKHEVFPPKPPPPRNQDPVAVDDWAEISSVGHRMGPAIAPVIIVEFADFQCPACRRFTLTSLDAIRKQYPTQVTVLFRNWPLPYHKQAYPAARAAECAGAQGRFEAIHDLFYSKQDSLGVKSFVGYASEAGVGDTNAFQKCRTGQLPLLSITADSLAVNRLQSGGKPLKAAGTPTIIINGLKLSGIPDSTTLDKLVQKALERRLAPSGHAAP